ncbi:MAG TPA: Calx-beta domain-containing protein [Thermoanaerobaculia bacterium]|jgi:hypothetical protein
MLRSLAVVAALTLALAPNALAARLDWTGAVDNRWSTPGNWNPAQVPVDGDTLRFAEPSPNTVLVNDLSIVLERLQFGSVPFTIGGNPVRVKTQIADGECRVTFTAPIEAEGPALIAAGGVTSLAVNGQTITLLDCDFNGSLTGHGTVVVYDTIRVGGTHPFTGQVFDGVFGFELNGTMTEASFRVSHELAGTGSAGRVEAYGRIAPGARETRDAATLTARDTVLRGSAFAPEELGAYIVDINPGGNDRLAVHGTVLIENKPLEVVLPNNFNPAVDSTYVILDNDDSDPISGTFGRLLPNGEIEPLPEGATFNVGKTTFRISYSGGTGNDVVLRVQPARLATKVSAFYGLAETGHTLPIDVVVETDPAGGTISGGTVTIREGSTILGSAQVTDNAAQVLIGPLSRGLHTLIIDYSGDETHLGSTTTVFVDVVAPQSTLAVSDASRAEGNSGSSLVDVLVTLSSSALFPISVDYTTGGGTATPGLDYVPASGTITFSPGQTGRRITLTILGDEQREPGETFFVTLSNATGGILADATGVVTIVNDDEVAAVYPNLEFARPGGVPLRLNLSVPFGAGPHPVIVVVNANDWASPVRDETLPVEYTARGYAVASIEFRPSTSAPFPAQLSDVKSAIRWLRANELLYRLDSTRIGIWGRGAAGGHLAALAALTADAPPDDQSGGNWGYSSRIRAAVVSGGATDLLQVAGSCVPADAITQLLGCSPEACAGTARFASPTTYVTRDDPPFLIGGGCGAQGALLHGALRAVGVDATLGEDAAAFFERALKEVRVKRRATR